MTEAELVSTSVTMVTVEPAASSTPTSGNGAARTFGPGRSARTATHAASPRCGLTHGAEPGDVLVEMSVAEVEPHDVDTRDQHRVEHVRRVTGRPERGHDLRPGVHT